MAGSPCYLVIHEKKNADHQDYSKIDPSTMVMNPAFHFTDSFDSRISENLIWFRADMTASLSRWQAAKNAETDHLRWKIQAEINYIKACQTYVKDYFQHRRQSSSEENPEHSSIQARLVSSPCKPEFGNSAVFKNE